MGMTRWQDLHHKASPEQMDAEKRETIAEYEQMGYGAVRKARSLTQVEVAERLNVSQAAVATIETRTDLLLSTLGKYIRALGGELEVRAVFPETTFNLEPPAETAAKAAAAKANPGKTRMRLAATT